MRWDDLNMGDKSRMIKLAVDSGITDLRTIRDVYNSYAEGGHLFWPGGSMNLIPHIQKAIAKGYGVLKDVLSGDPEKQKKVVEKYHENADKIPPKAHRFVYNVLKDSAFGDEALSNIIPNAWYHLTHDKHGFDFSNHDNVFLMSPSQQQEELVKLGYKPVDTSEGYGLVNAAVNRYKEATGRSVPMYQLGNDEIDRKDVIPINNDLLNINYANPDRAVEIEEGWTHFEPASNIGDSGSTPTRIYRDKDGQLYFKKWDFFDHGDYSRNSYKKDDDQYVTKSLTDNSQIYGNLLDIAGNPFVKVSGITKYPDQKEILQVFGNEKGYGLLYPNLFDEDAIKMEELKTRIKNGEFDIKAYGGKIYIKPENHGTLFAMGGKPKRRKTLITELPEVVVTPQWLSYWDATPEQTRGLTNKNGKYNTTSMGDKEYTHFDTISARYKGLNAAMQRANFSEEEMGRLSPFLLTQLALEGGWVVDRPDNNFGGMMSGGKRIEFDTEDSFYDTYLKNLDARWGDEYLGKGKGWRNAKTINEYADIINREDLGLHTKEAFDDYNRKHRDHPAYIYTPLWENNNTGLMDENKFGGIYDRALGNYELLMKRMGEWDKFARNNKIFAK